MKLSETVFLGLMLAMLAVMVTVSGKPKTYLIETVDDALAEGPARRVGGVEEAEGADYIFDLVAHDERKSKTTRCYQV